VLGGRWTQKPFQGTLLDRSHLYGYNLQLFYPLWEGAGSNASEAINGTLPLTANGFGSTNPWFSYDYGPAIHILSPTTCYYITCPTNYQFGLPITLMLGCHINGNSAASHSFVWGVSANNSNASPFAAYSIDRGSGSGFATRSNTGGTVRNGTTVATTTGSDYVVAATYEVSGSNSVYTLYFNGVQQAQDSFASTSAPNFSATSLIQIGNFAGVLNTKIDYYWVALWNYRMPAALITQIGQNVNEIYQVFRPQPFWWLAGARKGGSYYFPGRTNLWPQSRPVGALYTTQLYG
jgi:hypothetical protein